MNLSEYRKRHGLSQSEFAGMLQKAGFPATQGLVSFWELGRKKITAERALQIEKITGGEVRRVDLRPDLFGDLPPAANDSHSPPHAECEEAA